VIGGTMVIISIENLEPMIVYDLKRKRSPKTSPANPDNESHIQFSLLASDGRIIPLFIKVKILRNINPKTSLRTFTATEPILLLADSKAKEVTVQKQAVSKAANSPRWLSKNPTVYNVL